MPPKAQCGNPLFLEWAEEMHTQAAKAKLQSATTYRKAVTSIKSCPIPYARPAQLVSLHCVGPKMIDTLFKKQKEWCEARGIEVPGLEKGSDEEWWVETRGGRPALVGGMDAEEGEGEDDFDTEMSSLLIGRGGKAGPAYPRKRKLLSTATIDAHTTGSTPSKKRKAGPTSNADASADPFASPSKAGTKAKVPAKPKGKKVYIPKQSSGAYAILIGLVLELPLNILARGAPTPSDRIGGACMDEDDPLAPINNESGSEQADQHETLATQLSLHAIPKSDLVSRAEPHCSTSFTASEKGSALNGNFYTAWSNMKGLIEKGYVGTKGNPKKFWLTVEGFRSGLGLWKTAFPDQARELATFREEGWGLERNGGRQANAVAGPSSFGNQRDLNQPSPASKKRSKASTAAIETDREMAILFDEEECEPRIFRPGQTQLRSSSPDISMQEFGDDEIAVADSPEKDLAESPGRGKHSGGDGRHQALMSATGRREKSRGEQAIGGGLAGGSTGRKDQGGTAFPFWYIAEDGNQVLTRDKAKCRLDEVILRPMWLIRLDVRDLAHPSGRKLRKVKQSKGSGTIFEGYMLEGDAPERCTAGAEPIDAEVGRNKVPLRSGVLTTSPASRPVLPGGFDFSEDSECRSTVETHRERPPPTKTASASIVPAAMAVKSRKVSQTTTPAQPSEMGAAQRSDAFPARIASPTGASSPDSRAGLGGLRSSSPPPISERLDRQSSGRVVNVGQSRLLNLAPPTRTPPILAGSAGSPANVIEIDDPPKIAPIPVRSRETWQKTASAPEMRNIGSSKGPVPGPSRIMPRLSSAIPVQSPVAHDGSAPIQPNNEFSPSQATTFPGGTFDVILLMDTREIRSKRDELLIVQGLLSKGILVETRMLAVGDMCWIARSRTPRGAVTECVLDYVCERKRLDDLIGSIQGGRYEEQKYRLANSCLRHVYYIIEDWDVNLHKVETGLAIATAKSQTQITDGFFLKDTHRLSETIDFLRMMSEVIKQAHEFETLHIIPDRFISRPTYVKFQRHLRHVHPSRPFYTTYDTFQEINGKNSCRTLRDIFARMLLAIRGMSAERVGAVLDVWDTPASMWDAFDRRRRELSGAVSGPKERGLDLFFADAVVGEGRQKIGDALSREMYATLCN